MGVTTNTEVMDIRDRSQGEDPIWKTTVEQCTGVFMTGGDQVRLCGLLVRYPPRSICCDSGHSWGRNYPGRYQCWRGRHGSSYDCWVAAVVNRRIALS
jgi:hypothetical protein